MGSMDIHGGSHGGPWDLQAFGRWASGQWGVGVGERLDGAVGERRDGSVGQWGSGAMGQWDDSGNPVSGYFI